MPVRAADTTQRVRHDGPLSRGSIRSPILRCRYVPLPRFVVAIGRDCVERPRPNRKACAMRREPARDKRRGQTSAVMRGRIDGNVSGTHLFSARQHRARCSGAMHRVPRRATGKHARLSARATSQRRASTCDVTHGRKCFIDVTSRESRVVRMREARSADQGEYRGRCARNQLPPRRPFMRFDACMRAVAPRAPAARRSGIDTADSAPKATERSSAGPALPSGLRAFATTRTRPRHSTAAP